jgi:hypothetical protein
MCNQEDDFTARVSNFVLKSCGTAAGYTVRCKSSMIKYGGAISEQVYELTVLRSARPHGLKYISNTF